MKRLTLLLACFVISMGLAIAQNRPVTGVVIDENGEPVIGASVVVKGTNLGTVTDVDGNFSLSVSASATTIVAKYIGMVDQEVAISNNMRITLKIASTNLEEVVVSAYGITRTKNSISGSVSNIKGDALASVPTTGFDQALQGKMAGVQVSSASGLLADQTSIRIRGAGSMSLSSQPLVVVDGVPVTDVSNLNVFNGGNGTRFNPMATINQNDIESLEVLKDAAAAALYGSRAANGVLLITTKRGKSGSVKVTYNNYFGWAESVNLPDLLKSKDFMKIQNEAASNYWGQGTVIAAPCDLDGDGVEDETDWTKVAFRNGFSQNHQVSMSGGTDKLSFYGSADWLDQEGTVRANDLSRYSFRATVDARPTKWLKTGLTINYSKTENFGVISDGYLAGVTLAAYAAMPNVPEMFNSDYYLDANGRLNRGNNLYSYKGANTYGNAIYHPSATVDLQRNANYVDRFNAVGFAEITPIKGITVTSKLGVDNITNFEDQYSSPRINGLGLNYNGIVQDNIAFIKQWNWQNYANYRGEFGNHSLGVMAGIEYQDRDYQDIYAAGNNFVSDSFTNILDGLFTEYNSGGTMNSRGFTSYFGNISYDYLDKYYLDLSFRSDGYSGFGEDNKYGYFPGVSAAWRIGDESFMAFSKDWLSNLKLRGSWGVVGNSNVDPYASRTLYAGGQYADLNGISMDQVGNSKLKWENTTKSDFGIDADFFNGRISLNFDYWMTNVSDMLLKAEVIRTTGIPDNAVLKNIGEMSNKGIELQLNTLNYESKKNQLTWSSIINLTTVKNEIKALAGDDILGTNSLIVGQPMGVWRLYEWAGVDPQTGRPGYIDQKSGKVKYYDADPAVANAEKWKFADGSLAPALGGNDLKVQDGASGMPTWYGNFDNTVKWKYVDFTLGLQFSGGNKILNATRAGLLESRMSNKSTEILERWTTPGQITDVPRLVWGQNTGLTTSNSTRFLENADFLRIREITLGYSFPRIISNKLGVTGRIYARVNNLYVFTNYKGSDPELSTSVNRTTNGYYFVGTDNRSVPASRIYTVGLSLNF